MLHWRLKRGQTVIVFVEQSRLSVRMVSIDCHSVCIACLFSCLCPSAGGNGFSS